MPRFVESVDGLVKFGDYLIFRLEQLRRALRGGQRGRALIVISREITSVLQDKAMLFVRKMRALQYTEKMSAARYAERSLGWDVPESVLADFWEEHGDPEAAEFLRESDRIDREGQEAEIDSCAWDDEWRHLLWERIGHVPDWDEQEEPEND